MKGDEEVMGEFGALAKSANLSQEQAQKIVDLQGKAALKTSEAVKAHFADIGGTPDNWPALAKADPELAGDGGDKFNENLALAAKCRDRFGTPALEKVLNKTRTFDHPEVLRFFLRVGKAISEDGFAPGRSGGSAKTDAEVFYSKPKS